MYKIHKIRADHVIDFAAEELKKYLRCMMPDCGDISIDYDPDATDGFRLGVLEDFGLPNEAPDPKFDDVIHVDTTDEGGIMSGSNPRSVLFAVYRYLRLNGCRFLFPGMDGEYIPRKVVTPQKYHKMADHRLRGHTTEGEPSAEQVLMYIDYHAKQELNYYGLLGIFTYHDWYYKHWQNTKNREPEPITREQAEQWKGIFESELLKRGMILSDGNHDFMIEAIGIDYGDNDAYIAGTKQLTEEQKSYTAMVDGKRGLWHDKVLFTQMCMSRPDFRTKYVKVIADFAEKNPQVTMMNVSLGDGSMNHCECPECQKLRPSDFLVMILNELDEELTRRGLDTKISFSNYVDQMFPPVQERIKNPDRFYLTWAPITRSYTSSITEDTVFPEIQPYVRNNWKKPETTEECAAYMKAWQQVFPGNYRIFEYHYWRPQYLDPGLMAISRRIYEDVLALKHLNINVSLEDGSNKSFFPHGFHSHIYSATLMDRDCDYEAELEDYFSHTYGKDWRKVRAYFDAVSEAFSYEYMNGEESADPNVGIFYNPDRAVKLGRVKELAASARKLAKEHLVMPTRPQTVCYRLLNRHAELVEGLAKIMIEKSLGNDSVAQEMILQLADDFGRHDWELDRYFDFGLLIRTYKTVLGRSNSNIILQ